MIRTKKKYGNKRRKSVISIGLCLSVICLAGCGNAEETQVSQSSQEVVQTDDTQMPETAVQTEVPQETEVSESLPWEETGSRVLIAYFSRLDNTDADLDTIIQGGGPYGDIGDAYEGADLDAIASASITVRDGEVMGNTRAVAEMIQQWTGGDLFSIRTTETYPVDYDDLIDLGGEERNTNARPELVEQIGDISDYDIVFIGFPNWWYDMPMAVYSFLESADFAGKRIIPFATSASSGLSGAVASIQTLQPEAEVETQGLHIPMRDVAEAKDQVEEWLADLDVPSVQDE